LLRNFTPTEAMPIFDAISQSQHPEQAMHRRDAGGSSLIRRFPTLSRTTGFGIAIAKEGA